MKHCFNEVSEELARARQLNCRIVERGHVIQIFPQNRLLGFYTGHKTQTLKHNLRRFLNRVENER